MLFFFNEFIYYLIFSNSCLSYFTLSQLTSMILVIQPLSRLVVISIQAGQALLHKPAAAIIANTFSPAIGVILYN